MPETFEKPPLLHSLLEMRAPLEALSLAPSMRFLNKVASGDGQPVVILPGFMTGDGATFVLRRFLSQQGFATHGWEQGRNPGLRQDILEDLTSYIDQLYTRYGQKISLVGWSLGGLYARALAHTMPEKIRQVITLGTPFKLDSHVSEDELGVSGPILKLYERLNPNVKEDPLANGDPIWEHTPNVPSTAIYSSSDGVISWKYCLDAVSAVNENIRVFSSHIGLTHNPFVLYLLANRLAQPESHWQAFKPKGLAKLFFK